MRGARFGSREVATLAVACSIRRRETTALPPHPLRPKSCPGALRVGGFGRKHCGNGRRGKQEPLERRGRRGAKSRGGAIQPGRGAVPLPGPLLYKFVPIGFRQV